MRCHCITAKGRMCKRIARSDTLYCYQHTTCVRRSGTMLIIESNKMTEHLTNIREQIVERIVEILSLPDKEMESKLGSPKMQEYIETQSKAVLTGLSDAPSDDPDHPSNVDPLTASSAYYREAINEFSTVFKDYDDDPEGTIIFYRKGRVEKLAPRH